MDPIARQTALAAAGGVGEATYVDDVFSTFLYEGNNSTLSIANGIDLSNEGGLVWLKRRSATSNHALWDTERGVQKGLSTNNNSSESDATGNSGFGLTAFNSDGFTLGSSWMGENSSGDYTSWTFRKAPGFFDVVTWTGNGTNRTISHNLGSTPGFIIIKRYSNAEDWTCWHRSVGATKYLQLNGTGEAATLAGFMNNTEPTSTEFTVGTHDRVNTTGETYLAYLFAHDDQSFGTSSDEAIIKCGSYTEASSGVDVDLGFEPQWVLTKLYDDAGNGLSAGWRIFDSMRGMIVGSGDRFLEANQLNAEGPGAIIDPTSTGFIASPAWGNGTKHVYIAIRRPNKPPTDADDVFDIDTFAGSGSAEVISTTFTVDASLTAWRNRNYWPTFMDRLRGGDKELYTASTAVENTGTTAEFDFQTGLQLMDYSGDSGYNLVNYSFRRAPGFFDVVLFSTTGTNAALNVNHNLGATPELMIVKTRTPQSDNWYVYHEYLGGTHTLRLNSDEAASDADWAWDDTDPTASVFTVGTNLTTNTGDHVAYLFATLDGISKVGSYSGTGNDIDVDCGFSAGARFVLIKRTDTRIVNATEWYVWDTARGIVSGNDEYLLLNEDGTNTTTNTDYIDPLNSGFTVTSSAPAALNTSGGTYVFFAIA